MTDVLVQHRWLAPTVFVVLVVVGPGVGAWLAPRPRIARALTVVSLLPVLAVTLVPVQRELYARCTLQWALPTPDRAELFANLLLFVAPALLAGVATRRPVFAIACGSGLSAVIEGVQALLPVLGRSCDTTDWLSNTLGAVVGGLLAGAALVLARRARPGSSPLP
jgi:hypothetical protein